ncbi:MAG: thiamine-phosphate kinase [Candidatus Omnitrophota bacterium]
MSGRQGRSALLQTIGEFGLIGRLAKWAAPKQKDVLVGIGDDAAVIRCDRNRRMLLTTDMLIEGRHFTLGQASFYQVGRKAMAVNISDIAAMGGIPLYAVVAVGLGPKTSVEQARQLYRGLKAIADRFGVEVVGGDTNRSERLVVSVALVGEVSRRQLVLRSGARRGDVIYVSGSLGGSYVSKKHLRFVPCVDQARFLVKHFKLHSMIDLSDGLASDLTRVCQASRVGALIETARIPVSRSAKSLRHALCDGEDFELLFTLDPRQARRLEQVSRRAGFTFVRIGRIVGRAYGIRLMDPDGRVQPLKAEGYDHFK